MKKSRLLITLLAMLVVVCGYAQDTYRQAVKDYLVSSGQWEKNLSLLSDLNMLYANDGSVDIEQLSKKYIDERFENDVIDFILPMFKERGLTEADLREVASLLSTPEGKVFDAHQQDWMAGVVADMLMPFFGSMGDMFDRTEEYMDSVADVEVSDEDVVVSVDGDEEPAEDIELTEEELKEIQEEWKRMQEEWKQSEEDWDIDMSSILGEPVQPNADIDAAYAAKFRDVFMESVLVKNMMAAMSERLDSDTTENAMSQKDRDAFWQWMNTSIPNILLNNAYGIMTLEDIDYAKLLYSKDSYCKLADFYSTDKGEINSNLNVFTKYMEWMEEQGAEVSDDPDVAMKFLQSLLNLGDLDLDDDAE